MIDFRVDYWLLEMGLDGRNKCRRAESQLADTPVGRVPAREARLTLLDRPSHAQKPFLNSPFPVETPLP